MILAFWASVIGRSLDATALPIYGEDELLWQLCGPALPARSHGLRPICGHVPAPGIPRVMRGKVCAFAMAGLRAGATLPLLAPVALTLWLPSRSPNVIDCFFCEVPPMLVCAERCRTGVLLVSKGGTNSLLCNPALLGSRGAIQLSTWQQIREERRKALAT
ncbi:hypothetical protein QYF61_022486 [Mycteria americana]|uniref:Uncharacterized protein n=1 Tax=Mycteria americana TaxID=33587 RepID=A0AAN7RRP4_MYCAM|nr:hypothetical protein QYF61_022486 [Mycteria americana]